MRLTMYFPIIDSIVIELNERFSCRNLEITKSIASLSPFKAQKENDLFYFRSGTSFKEFSFVQQNFCF
jgi:hypothetical protein